MMPVPPRGASTCTCQRSCGFRTSLCSSMGNPKNEARSRSSACTVLCSIGNDGSTLLASILEMMRFEVLHLPGHSPGGIGF